MLLGACDPRHGLNHADDRRSDTPTAGRRQNLPAQRKSPARPRPSDTGGGSVREISKPHILNPTTSVPTLTVRRPDAGGLTETVRTLRLLCNNRRGGDRVDGGQRIDAGSIEDAADAGTAQSAATSRRRRGSPVWRLGKVTAGIVVGLATIASFVVAWLQAKSQLEQIEAQTRPPVVFDQRIDSPASVTAFVSFVTENDYQVRRVNLPVFGGRGSGLVRLGAPVCRQRKRRDHPLCHHQAWLPLERQERQPNRLRSA